MAESGKQRLAYIDWMRGLACLLMFQTHSYDSWLGGAARNTAFLRWSQLGGTLPAPLFLFLAGISCALLTDRMRRKGVARGKIARTFIQRGAEIFGLGLLFRMQEFILGQPWAPWTDLLRADVLNVIGLSLVFMGAMCGAVRGRAASVVLAAAIALGVALATPPLWTTWRPRWLPWYLESYINGVHTFHVPQPWLFPVFPWTAFAFAGLAAIMGGNGLSASMAKLPGSIMALGGAIRFAVGTVLAKKSPIRLPPIPAAAWQIGIAGLPVALVGLSIETTHLERVSGPGWWLLLYSTVIQFCVAYVSWFAALARLQASVAAIGTMAVPVIGVVGSAIALHEPLGPGQIAALMLTLASVVLATRS